MSILLRKMGGDTVISKKLARCARISPIFHKISSIIACKSFISILKSAKYYIYHSFWLIIFKFYAFQKSRKSIYIIRENIFLADGGGVDVWPQKWGEGRWVTKKMGGG